MRWIVAVWLLCVSVAAADPIEVGPGTTVLEGPVRADGTVDYAAAINAAGAAIDPADNAAVVLAAVMSQTGGFAEGDYEARVLELLGWPGADPGLVVVNPAWLGVCEWEDRWWREPEAVAWLEANAAVLDAVRDAPAERGAMWWPVVVDDAMPRERLLYVLMPQLGSSRRWGRVLAGRAALRREAGDLRGVWADIVGIAAWSERVQSGAYCTLIEHLVGISLRDWARREALALTGATDSALLAEMQAGWVAMPALRPMAEVWDGDRVWALDYWQGVVVGQLSIVDLLADDADMDEFYRRIEDGPWGQTRDFTKCEPFDPNVGLRRLNAWYDRIQAISGLPTAVMRSTRADALGADIDRCGRYRWVTKAGWRQRLRACSRRRCRPVPMRLRQTCSWCRSCQTWVRRCALATRSTRCGR